MDWQWSRGNWSEELAEERWADRLVIETNLVKTWRALIGRYLQRAEKPFSIDPGTLQRDDRPPDYIAFRDGVINLLIHQDYADHTRKPVIRSFDDRPRLATWLGHAHVSDTYWYLTATPELMQLFGLVASSTGYSRRTGYMTVRHSAALPFIDR